ncbi:hypothetical protein ACAN107058_22590 [Paracidovorax anthurii]|uniref:Uncharacterized protein n=1 Tax=Paracidovorax anthurii TaxID=78229 RepID=A0A328YE41_9BURK|nr:hypothetical protein AX018_11023 [Paracidovorax anthurii]
MTATHTNVSTSATSQRSPVDRSMPTYSVSFRPKPLAETKKNRAAARAVGAFRSAKVSA